MEKYVMARNFNSHLAFFGVEFALQSLIADMEMFMDRSENDEASVVSRPVSMLMLLSLLISSALLIFLVTAMKAFFDLKKSNSINGNSPDRKWVRRESGAVKKRILVVKRREQTHFSSPTSSL